MDEKKKLMGWQYFNPTIDEFNPNIDKDKVKQAFENPILYADGVNKNEVSYLYQKIAEQHELIKTKIIIQDIIKAYRGDITWDEYLRERKQEIKNVRETNQTNIINLETNPSEYKIEYRLEPPMLDFTTFMIAVELGKLERNEDHIKDVLSRATI